MGVTYLFSFTVEGDEPFTREFDLLEDATAIDLARTAALHQVEVKGAPRASVLVARAVSPDGMPLGVWCCTQGGEPVWREATAEGEGTGSAHMG